jgi:hypothetical protein
MKKPSNSYTKEIESVNKQLKEIQDSTIPDKEKAYLIENLTHLIASYRYLERKESQEKT